MAAVESLRQLFGVSSSRSFFRKTISLRGILREQEVHFCAHLFLLFLNYVHQIRKIMVLCCVGTVLFASCKKTTPRHEQKSDTSPEVAVQPDDPKKDTPQPDTPEPPKNDPPTPAPPKVDPPKSEEPKLEVLQPGVVRITNLAPGELASTFHKNNFNDADRKKVTKLIIQSGGLSQADLTYIRYHFLVKELDLTTASLSLADTDEGFYNNSTITKLIFPANLTKVTDRKSVV